MQGYEIDILQIFLSMGGKDALEELLGHRLSDVCELSTSILQDYVLELNGSEEDILE